MSKPVKPPTAFTAVQERHRKLWRERHPEEFQSMFPEPEEEPEEEDTSHFREVDDDNPGWRSYLW